MRYKSKDYATALASLILEKKSESRQKAIVDNFFMILRKNGDLKKAREIIFLTETLFFKKSRTSKIILETARKIKKEPYFASFKKDVFEEKINPEMVAGIKIIVNGEKQLDFSLKNKLEEVFSKQNLV